MRSLVPRFAVVLSVPVGASAQAIPENAHRVSWGKGWGCNPGFRETDRRCVRVIVPDNAPLDITGHNWTCNRGYRRSGSSCVVVAIPEKTYRAVCSVRVEESN